MPRGDGTGPAGMGPMTGRAAGFCAGHSAPGYANPAGGCGYGGRGRGGGRGRRNWYYATSLPGWARASHGYPAWGGPARTHVPHSGPVVPAMMPEQELEGLKRQAEYFEGALGEIKKRIDQLESEDNK